MKKDVLFVTAVCVMATCSDNPTADLSMLVNDSCEQFKHCNPERFILEYGPDEPSDKNYDIGRCIQDRLERFVYYDVEENHYMVPDSCRDAVYDYFGCLLKYSCSGEWTNTVCSCETHDGSDVAIGYCEGEEDQMYLWCPYSSYP